MKTRFRNICILLIVLVNAGCDQISKQVARENIGEYEEINVIGKHLILIKTENSGAFLSAGDSIATPVKFIFLSLLPLIALSYGIYYLLTHSRLPRLLVLGIAFVIGGGIGNLYDRLIYGSVTDFMHIDFYIFKTGIFNFADVSIMMGMMMLIVHSYHRRIQTHLVSSE